MQTIGRVVENHFLSEPLQRFCMLFYHRFHMKSIKTRIFLVILKIPIHPKYAEPPHGTLEAP